MNNEATIAEIREQLRGRESTDLYWQLAKLLEAQGELEQAAEAYLRAAKAGKVRYPKKRSAQAQEALEHYNALLNRLHEQGSA